MKLSKKIIPFCSLIFLLFSCKKSESLQNNSTDKEYLRTDTLQTDKTTASENKNKIGKISKKFSDFIPKDSELQYEAEGDMNQDGLSDAALVIKKKDDSMGDRTVLILLKNPDKNYRLDKISNTVFPLEYTDNHYKIYDTEDISISKGELNIKLYGIGPSGNLFSTFKYVRNNLFLTYIETYNMGAGSHQALYYEVMKGVFKQTAINTMEEEMPSETKTLHLKKERFLFENTSPDEVIQNAYKNLDSNNW